MKENQLLRVSIIFSLIGILILFYLTENIEPRTYDINSIGKDNIDNVIKIKGEIGSFTETPGLYLISLKDDTGMITVVIFKDEDLRLFDGLKLEIIGEVVEYQNTMEVIAKEIVI